MSTPKLWLARGLISIWTLRLYLLRPITATHRHHVNRITNYGSLRNRAPNRDPNRLLLHLCLRSHIPISLASRSVAASCRLLYAFITRGIAYHVQYLHARLLSFHSRLCCIMIFGSFCDVTFKGHARKNSRRLVTILDGSIQPKLSRSSSPSDDPCEKDCTIFSPFHHPSGFLRAYYRL